MCLLTTTAMAQRDVKPPGPSGMKRYLTLSEDSERSSKDVKKKSRLCPYLDTINRHMLDFDFEKLCSVSLSRINVYACLVCGKYFQGRGPNTHAYTQCF